ncbi:MAG: phosphate ABC transporter substrate-binding protein PstS [Pseudonocardiales bacterium]|nr:MAG: phosphate ABC transporter substrate-binding protein PstS [Pseudonocardiales bacterium]
MKLYRAGAIAGLIACAVVLSACSSSKKDTPKPSSPGGTGTAGGSSAPTAGKPTCSTGKLDAEGSTAQTNAINQWISDYQAACPGATINYNPTGSGAGVTSFTGGLVDFAGSDSALDPKKDEVTKAQKRCGSTPLDLPMVVGPIAIAFKLKGVDKLTLTGEVIAKIFLGKITTWNAPEITGLNKGVTIPPTKISVFYRSDSSGTTQNFERYLAATAPSLFTTKPDKDSSKAGFAGQGKAKSQGVAAAIAAVDGGVGYDEFSFAVSSGLSTASVDNGGGAVELSKDTASAAANAAKVVGTGSDLSLQIDYATKTAGAYPIILVTYEIVCTKYQDTAKGTFVKNFLSYTVEGGQAALAGLGYAPLPADLQAKVKASIATIS